jgi:hypothetical protein
MPTLSDSPNIEGSQSAFQAIDSLVTARFATTAARNAAITAPVAGQMAYCTDTNELYMYSSVTSSWVGARPRTKYKTVTQIVNNSVTLVADDTLFVTLEGSSVYSLRFVVPMQAATAAGFKWQFTIPASSAGFYFPGIRQQLTTAATFYLTRVWNDVPAVIGTDGTEEFLIFEGDIATVTAGTIQLLWAQNAANVSNTSVFAGATVTAFKFK